MPLMALISLQEYIEHENERLSREGQFWSKEIVVKIEYKYCPNLTIIDTPGNITRSYAFLSVHAQPGIDLYGTKSFNALCAPPLQVSSLLPPASATPPFRTAPVRWR
jgi:hypothetical protein